MMSQPTTFPEISDFEANLLYESDLIAFLDALRERAHHLYAQLASAPKSVFGIVQDDEDAYPDAAEFLSRTGKFDAEDSFRVYFIAYFFRQEWDQCVPYREDTPLNGMEKCEIMKKAELSPAMLESEWPHLPAYLCREAMLKNKPFRLDEKVIRQYGFTAQDIAML